MAKREKDLSDKLRPTLEKNYNKKIPTVEELCSLPPKDFILFITKGELREKSYEPLTSSVDFNLVLNSLRSSI